MSCQSANTSNNMKQNQLYRLAIVGVLWLSIGAGCQKDPPLPECDNGSCCWPGEGLEFVKRANGTPADFDGLAFSFKEAITEFKGVSLYGALTCPVQEQEVTSLNLKANVFFDPVTGKARLADSTQQYPYLVWGIIYKVDIPTIAGYPLHSIRVEKVESAR